MSETTPGEWIRDGQTVYALGRDGRNRMDFRVNVKLNGRHGSDEAVAEAEADAQLCAAAPELLEACRGLLMGIAMSVSACEYLQPDDGALKAARAAIAKAEGRPANGATGGR